MSWRCARLLSTCVLLMQHALCVVLPRHNIATTVPLRLVSSRAGRNRGGIALAITRELALHRAWDSKALSLMENRKQAAANRTLDEIIEFYGKQQHRILRDLLLPTLGDDTEQSEPTLKSTKNHLLEWEIVISTEKRPLQCAVLASVPPGTVMVRPKIGQEDGNGCCYVSIHALNSLARSKPGCLEMIFPNVGPLNLQKLYAHSSLMTSLASSISCNSDIRRMLSICLMVALTAASHRVILDILFTTLRTDTLWNPQIYSLWSRIYHTPTPMLLITAKKGVETLLLTLAYIEDYIRDWSLDIEGSLLNSDILGAIEKRLVVEDYKGRQQNYETCFNPVHAY